MGKEYQVSVVTPFHNTKIAYFKNCIKSMTEQTIGFENIEWIIVFHNCSQEYIDEASGLVSGYENVRTYTLYNDVHSPSSPRNYGMGKVTAKYLSFLDADDSFTPYCFEKALFHMKRSGADITWFRREFELEDAGNLPMTEIVLWNQTQEEIIIEKDVNWDNEKIFSGVWGLVTSRIYNTAFIKDNQILFDDEANFAEDYLFNLVAYGHARKLCYLPQMIGYHYFINGESLVQKNEKTPETLIQMAKGFSHIFDTGFRYGFYMDAILGGLLYTEMRFMMGTKGLTLEDRIKIKDILEPYLDRMKPIRPSKLYSEKAVYERFYTVKDYILNPEKWDGTGDGGSFIPDYAQGIRLPSDMDVIRKILEDNSSTDMGSRFNFNDIITVSGYQSMVPLMDYSFYRPLVALTTRIGESGVFVNEKIDCYVTYLDRENSPVTLPVTKSHLKTYVEPVRKVLDGCVTFPLFSDADKVVRYNDNTLSGSIYSLALNQYVQSVADGSTEASGRMIVPFQLISDEAVEGYYFRALYALACEDITQILAPNTWSVFRFLTFIYGHKDRLCSDIEHGTISAMSKEDKARIEALTHTIKGNPKRAKEVKAVLDHPESLELKKLWPGLKYITAYGADAYRLYTYLLRKAGSDLTFRALDITAEAVIGTHTEEPDRFFLNTGSYFFELRETDENGCPVGDAYLPASAEKGKTYRLYVTNSAGLYRYDTGRLIRVEDVIDGSVLYTPENMKTVHQKASGRLPDFESGYEAIVRAIDELQLMISEYVYAADGDVLRLFVEILGNAESRSDELAGKVSGIVGECLNRKVEVSILDEESMQLYADITAREHNVAEYSLEPLHLACSDDQLEFLKINSI